MSYHLWLDTALIFLLIAGARCLRNVSLEVIPKAVGVGHEALLRCRYDLAGDLLYSVKWYRGKHEFYRYSPSDEQQTKIFEIPGLSVNREKSNASQVTINNVDFALTGTFSCEVTADAPTYSTVCVSANLTVVLLPQSKPEIVTEKERYNPGDTLRANCSSPPSRPPVRLSFTLNNLPIEQESVTRQHQQQEQQQQQRKLHYPNSSYYSDRERQWNALSLTLQQFHYANGQLNLRCIAEIPGIYSADSEVHLSPGLREPVPERVTFENSACKVAMDTLAYMTTLLLLLR